jgi:ABC-type spermidine/putrescine transport system permease subunit I
MEFPSGAAGQPAARFRAWLTAEDGARALVFYLPLVFMCLFLVAPLGLTLVWSVFPRTRFWMEPGFTLAAYEKFFLTPRLDNFLHSMMYGAAAVVISFVLGFPIAVFVRRRIPVRAQHAVVLLFILPFMISELIRTFSLRPVLGRTGLVNSFLQGVHLIDEPISVILYTPLGMILGVVLSFLPIMVFASFLALEAVERYVFEVCDDLGGGVWATLRNVIIPLGAPGIFAGALFIFVNAIGLALIPDLLGGPGAVNAGIIVLNAIQVLDFPLAMAISAVLIVTMVLLLYVGHRLFDLTKLLEPIKK